jgi:hypothetical protein
MCPTLTSFGCPRVGASALGGRAADERPHAHLFAAPEGALSALRAAGRALRCGATFFPPKTLKRFTGA